jgi:dihydrodipicolinate synthase/N-acetylneuraminate lyase
MTVNLDGLIPATVLPMGPDGMIDEPALRRYIGWVSRQGPVALALNADTGEGPHLTHAEKVRVLEVVREETNLPVIAGVSGPFTSQAVAQARDYRAAGASALLVFPISAYLSTPLDPEIPLGYHRAIAEVGLPLILFQLQPALGGVNFETETLRQLIALDGVVAIKEASFDARRYLDTFRMVEQTPKYERGEFTYLTGNDNFILESFILGCTGALIGFGAIMVSEQAAMIDAWRDGRTEEARELGRRVQRLADVVFAAPVANYRARLKEALAMLGILEDASVRPPLVPVDSEERRVLRDALAEVGLLAGVAT